MDLIVPGSGSVVGVLQTIYALCNEMKESQEACTRVYRRLADVLTEIERSAHTPSSDATERYVEMLREFAAYLTRYKAKPLYARLLQYQKMLEKLKLLHEEIDTLLGLLNIATGGAVRQWKQEWEADRDAQTTLLIGIVSNSENVLSEMRSMREQIEALTVLRYELQQQRLPKPTLEAARRLHTEIECVSQATVDALPPWFISQLDLEYDAKSFARGSYGALHRGTWRSGTPVVVKTLLIDENGHNDDAAKAQFLHEIELWHKLAHPNIVKMFGACHVTSPPFILCEDAIHGNLAMFLRDHGKSCMWGFLHDAALGLEYLHANHIVHGDIKLNNFLVGSDGATRVADFGLSFSVHDRDDASNPRATGGLKWLAPECLTESPTFASDVYALGMCVVEAATGEPPFTLLDDKTIREHLRDGQIPERPMGLPDDSWELVVAMTAKDPAKRPQLAEVITVLKTLMKAHDTSLSRAAVLQMSLKPNVASWRSCNEQTEIPDLITALQSRDEVIRLSALKWLLRRADDEDKAFAIKRADGYRLLLHARQLPDTSWKSEVYVDQVLDRLWMSSAISYEERSVVKLPSPPPECMAELLESLKHPERDEQHTLDALDILRLVQEWEYDQRVEYARSLTNLLGASVKQLFGEAVRTLCDLTKDAEIVDMLLENDVVPLLFKKLENGTVPEQEQAIVLLGRLASVHDDVANLALTQRLVELACGNVDSLRVSSSSALYDVLVRMSNRHLMVEANGFQSVVDLIADQNATVASHAVNTIDVVIADETSKRALFAAGAIERLCAFAIKGDAEDVIGVLYMLARLARGSERRANAIRDAGGIRLAVAKLRSGENDAKRLALHTLRNVAITPSNRHAVATAGAIIPMVEVLRSGNGIQMRYAAQALANLAHHHESNARLIRTAGVIPLVVQLLLEDDYSYQRPILRALERLAQNPENVPAILATDVTHTLLELTGDDCHEKSALAIATLHHLRCTNELALLSPIDYCDIVERSSELPSIFALNKLAKISQTNCEDIVAAGAILHLVEVLHVGSEKGRSLATRVLLRLLKSSIENGRAIADAGAVTSLTTFVLDGNEGLSTDAMDLMAGIASISDEYRSVIIRAGATPHCARCMTDGYVIRQHDSAKQALAALAGGSPATRQATLDALLALLRSDVDVDKESGLAALASLAGDTFVCCYIVTNGVVPQLVQLASTGTAIQKKLSASLLRSLVACDEAYSDAIARADGVSSLAALLEQSTDSVAQTRDAAFVVGTLARHDNKRRAELVKLHVVPPLVEMARAGDEQQKHGAAFALGSLLKSGAAQRELQRVGGVEALQTLAKTGTPEQAEAAQRALAIGAKCRVS